MIALSLDPKLRPPLAFVEERRINGWLAAACSTIDAVRSDEPSSMINQANGRTVCRSTDAMTVSKSASSFLAEVSKTYRVFILLPLYRRPNAFLKRAAESAA